VPPGLVFVAEWKLRNLLVQAHAPQLVDKVSRECGGPPVTDGVEVTSSVGGREQEYPRLVGCFGLPGRQRVVEEREPAHERARQDAVGRICLVEVVVLLQLDGDGFVGIRRVQQPLGESRVQFIETATQESNECTFRWREVLCIRSNRQHRKRAGRVSPEVERNRGGDAVEALIDTLLASMDRRLDRLTCNEERTIEQSWLSLAACA